MSAIPNDIDTAQVAQIVGAVHFKSRTFDFGADGLRLRFVVGERFKPDGRIEINGIGIEARCGIVQSRLRHDLNRGKRMGIPPLAQNRYGHLHALDPLLDNHMFVEREGVEYRLAQIFDAINAMNAQGRPAMRGLHGHGEAADHALLDQIERGCRSHIFERVASDADALRP